jgi:hypothetical protein
MKSIINLKKIKLEDSDSHEYYSYLNVNIISIFIIIYLIGCNKSFIKLFEM